LSFIPPDGRFSLLEYEAPPVAQLPLSIKAGMTMEDNGGELLLFTQTTLADVQAEYL